MRRIVMFNRVTADGCFAGEDGHVNWFTPDPELDKAVMSRGGPQVDTFLFGRKTYEMFQSFWPQAYENPDSPAPHGRGGRLSPEQQQMAASLTETTKIVFSKTLNAGTWKNSRIVHDLDPQTIESLKQEPGHDMLLMGSGSIVSQLTEHGLIDEYQLVVCPILLGRGLPLLDHVSWSTPLELKEATAFPSGSVFLRYVPVR